MTTPKDHVSDELTDTDLDAADWRDLHNLKAFRDDPSLPDNIREVLERRIVELERRRAQRQLRRLQTGM